MMSIDYIGFIPLSLLYNFAPSTALILLVEVVFERNWDCTSGDSRACKLSITSFFGSRHTKGITRTCTNGWKRDDVYRLYRFYSAYRRLILLVEVVFERNWDCTSGDSRACKLSITSFCCWTFVSASLQIFDVTGKPVKVIKLDNGSSNVVEVSTSCDDNGENKQVNTIHVKKTILSFISKNLWFCYFYFNLNYVRTRLPQVI